MDRSTRNKVWGLMGALILCAGSAGLGQDIYLFGGEVVDGDPNEPSPPDVNVPWDPAQHLSASWDSVSLTSRVYNPAKYPGQDPNALNRSLSISGGMEVTDSNGLVGLTAFPVAVLALDQDGNEFYRSADPGPLAFSRMYELPRSIGGPASLAGLLPELSPYHFSVSTTLGPNDVYPILLSRLEWSLYALVADQLEVADLPFKTTADWVELIPGLKVLVEKATVSGTQYEYQVKSQYDLRKVSYMQPMPRRAADATLPERMVIEMQILNEKGVPVGGAGGSGGFGSSMSGTGSGEQMNYTSSGSGTCSDCGQATTFRFRLAVKPYEREVRFVLENVPVPSF
jgi:hypothetical protein